MYNSKFILENKTEIYPTYLDAESRIKLKELYKNKSHFMYCGCRTDKKLYYKISENLKIYPEHKNYVHDKLCVRYIDIEGKNKRKTAYCIDEDGSVTVYTSFDPKVFSPGTEDDTKTKAQSTENILDEETMLIIESDMNMDIEKIEKEEKEPELGLESLCRSINIDCFSDKILNNKNIPDRNKFSVYVFHRMKKVKLSRTKKAIGNLTLEEDNVRFIYLPFDQIIEYSQNGVTKCYIQTKSTTDNKPFKNFTFSKIAEKAIKKFHQQYGQEPDSNTMVAGFQYLKKTKTGMSYRVLGRIHLFQISDIGLYCRDMVEYKTFNTLHKIINNNEKIKFWIPPEDESIGAIIEIKGYTKKILLIFKTKKNKELSYNPDIYIPLLIDNTTTITEQLLYNTIDSN